MGLWLLLPFTLQRVRVADECKRWNTHYSGTLIFKAHSCPIFSRTSNDSTGACWIPALQGGKAATSMAGSPAHRENTEMEAAADVWGLPCVELSTGIAPQWALLSLTGILQERVEWEERKFKKFGLRILNEHLGKSRVFEGKGWALTAVLHQSRSGNGAGTLQQLLVPPTASAFSPQHSIPQHRGSEHSPEHPAEQIPPQHHHSAPELWNECSVSRNFVSTKQMMVCGGKAPFSSWLHR